MLQHEHIDWAEAEHHGWMAIEPITQPSPPGQREIFAHRQRIDVAHAAAGEISRRRVMHRMRVAPEIVWRERQHPDNASDPVIEPAAAEERAMAAVMLDHEQADEETGRR